MKLHIKKLTGKVGFVVAVAGAAIVGGVSTGVVMASIPDSNRNLNTCYRNNGGDLRVIDTATDSCSIHETAFNLSQAVNNSSTAYFRIKDGAIDTATMRNVSDYEWRSSLSSYCLEIAFDPLTSVSSYGVTLSSNSEASADTISNDCGSGFNAEVQGLAGEFNINGDGLNIWFAR